MKQITRTVLALLPVALCAACLIGLAWIVDYTYEATADAPLRTSPPGDGRDLEAADGSLRLQVSIDPGRIDLALHNDGPEALTACLDEARFVDGAGQASPLLVYDRENTRWGTGSPLPLAPSARVDLMLWPAALAATRGGEPFVTRADSPLGGSTVSLESREKALAEREGDVGKGFVLEIPVKAGDATRVYRMRFTVQALVPRRTTWA